MAVKDVTISVTAADGDETSLESVGRPVDYDNITHVVSGSDFLGMVKWLLGCELPDNTAVPHQMAVAVGMGIGDNNEPVAVIVHAKDRTYSLSPVVATASVLTMPCIAVDVEKQSSGSGEMLLAFAKVISNVLAEMAARSGGSKATRH